MEAELRFNDMPKLLFLAKAFAKLCLEELVRETHAVMSIYTLEEMNVALKGYKGGIFLKPQFSYNREHGDHEESFKAFRVDLMRNLTLRGSGSLRKTALTQEE